MPIHAAVAGGHLGLVQKLVSMGCSLKIEDLRQRTALHWAACAFVSLNPYAALRSANSELFSNRQPTVRQNGACTILAP